MIFLCPLFSLLNVALAMEIHAVPFKVRPVVPPTGVHHRIHDGLVAEEGQFPFMIFAMMRVDGSGISKCSSSLIGPEWVLLAAHCLHFPFLRARDVLLVGGKADLGEYINEKMSGQSFYEPTNEERWGVQERRAENFFIHPSYSGESLNHDIALIKLERPFRLGVVQTIPISTDKMTSPKRCTILGWGLTRGNADLQKLNYVRDKKVSTTEIGCHFKQKGPFICLAPDAGGICMGDSGSPLVCDGKVRGVASHYVTATEDSDCGDSLEEYYSELHPDVDWISEICTEHECGRAGAGTMRIIASLTTVLPCLAVSLWPSAKTQKTWLLKS